MSLTARSPSHTLLTDLALNAAIQLERHRAGMPSDFGVLEDLASALRRTSNLRVSSAPYRLIDPSYLAPLGWLYQTCESDKSGEIEKIQAFITKTSDALESVKSGDDADIGGLSGFCVTLHQALIDEVSAEDELAGHRGLKAG